MKFKHLFLGFALVGIMSTSCVPNKKYAELQTKYDELQTTYGSTREDLINCNANTRNLESQLQAAKQGNLELKKGMQDLKNTLDKSMDANAQGSVNIAKLVDEINASNQYIKQLVEAKSKSDSLNIALTNRLTRSLTTDEMKEVDVKVLKGVVYISLADNMLFKSGSYEVNSRAMETLSKIAKILKDYKDFDVLVEGNTDNVPISKTNIRNNWDLSALRASSIVQVLQNNFGIDPKRMSAAGRGEFNPISDNDSELANSVTAAQRSSSLRSLTSLWISSTRLPRLKTNLIFTKGRAQFPCVRPFFIMSLFLFYGHENPIDCTIIGNTSLRMHHGEG